jgi:hypothetical protein
MSSHCPGPVPGNLISEATTAFRLSAAEFVPIDRFERTALTPAPPVDRSVFLLDRGSLYNQQPAEGLSFEIN